MGFNIQDQEDVRAEDSTDAFAGINIQHRPKSTEHEPAQCFETDFDPLFATSFQIEADALCESAFAAEIREGVGSVQSVY